MQFSSANAHRYDPGEERAAHAFARPSNCQSAAVAPLRQLCRRPGRLVRHAADSRTPHRCGPKSVGYCRQMLTLSIECRTCCESGDERTKQKFSIRMFGSERIDATHLTRKYSGPFLFACSFGCCTPACW